MDNSWPLALGSKPNPTAQKLRRSSRLSSDPLSNNDVDVGFTTRSGRHTDASSRNTLPPPPGASDGTAEDEAILSPRQVDGDEDNQSTDPSPPPPPQNDVAVSTRTRSQRGRNSDAVSFRNNNLLPSRGMDGAENEVVSSSSHRRLRRSSRSRSHNDAENQAQPRKKQKAVSSGKSCSCKTDGCPDCAPDFENEGRDDASEYDSQSDTDKSSDDEEQYTTRKAKRVSLNRFNHCAQCSNGIGGLLASNACAKAPDTMATLASERRMSVSSDTDTNAAIDDKDLFSGTSFKTSSTLRVDESWVKSNLKGDGNKMRLKKFIDDNTGGIIQHPIGGSPEHESIVGIIYNSVKNREFQALSSESQSAEDPKTNRSGLSLVGTLKTIEYEYPDGYSTCSSAKGENVLKGLARAVAANNEAVGALRDKSHLYGLMWTKAVLSTRVAGTKTKGGLLMGGHPDQSKANDPSYYTVRNCIATSTPFNLDLIVYVVFLNDEGKQSTRQLGTITLKLPANTSYYLSHRGSGRAAIAQTTYDGKDALIVVWHRVYLDEKDLSSPRGVLINDLVFKTKEDHDSFLKMVDPSNKAKNLPPTFNNLTKLYNDLAKDDPSLKQYVKGGNLIENVLNTITNHRPCPNKFNLPCSNCSKTASALDLRERDGEDNGLSGEALRSHLESSYKKIELFGRRLLCPDCTSGIPEDEVLKNLCLNCLVRRRLGSLKSCTSCRAYRCIGYLKDAQRIYECEPEGVQLDERNLGDATRAICLACERGRNKLYYTRKTGDKDEKEIMRAVYQLYDKKYREMEENKKFLSGATRISWPNALHAVTGYGPLKGKHEKETRRLYCNFRKIAGKYIETLAEFEDYIKNDGEVGSANKGRKSIPMRMAFMTKQHRETIGQREEEDKSDDEDAGEGEEKWDLIEVIAVKDLKKKKPKKCQEEGCISAACSVWASNLAPDDKWYGCIDCMENYYEGWPSSAEMPVKHLTEEHRALLDEKCSERENPPMPDLPTTMPLSVRLALGR